MTAAARPKHRDDARVLLAAIGGHFADTEAAVDQVALALAEAEEYGMRRALHRLGPCIADAETARAELAREVDL